MYISAYKNIQLAFLYDQKKHISYITVMFLANIIYTKFIDKYTLNK